MEKWIFVSVFACQVSIHHITGGKEWLKAFVADNVYLKKLCNF